MSGVILLFGVICSKCAYDKGYEAHRVAVDALVRQAQVASVANTQESLIYQQQKQDEVKHAKTVSDECAFVSGFDYVGLCIKAGR